MPERGREGFEVAFALCERDLLLISLELEKIIKNILQDFIRLPISCHPRAPERANPILSSNITSLKNSYHFNEKSIKIIKN